MFYDYSLTIPAGTLESAPAKQVMKLTRGIIHRVEVEFYPGPRRYVYIRIMQGGHQLWPTNPEGSFRSDDYTIAFDEYQELSAAPFDLVIVGYSPGATYEHAVVVRIGILENKSAVLLLQALKGILKISRLLGVKV